ncbi:AMP-binding protein [Halorientalis marina]|uniref:AMP-binding protein n=1 Tax=Halorientalis marina TaxID=2931976 RepID=UPI001FF2ABDC|nr:AMP-binding protein [Halorientalis marina]
MQKEVEGLQGTTADAPLNTRIFLKNAARAHGDTEVITDTPDGVDRVTYRQMWNRTKRIANLADDLGISPGDVVGLYGHSTRRYYELVYAISNVGATPCTMNYELPMDHQRFCIEHIESHAPLDVIFVSADLLPSLESALGDPAAYRIIVVDRAGDDHETELDNVAYLDDLLEQVESEYDWPEVDERTAAILAWTSGTTGRPKMIAHDHRHVVLTALGHVASNGLGPQDSLLMVPPSYHYGWLFWAIAPAAGAKLVIPGVEYPDNLTDLIVSETVSFTEGVATLFKRIADTIEDRRSAGTDIDLDQLHVKFAGQKPSKDLMQTLEGLGATTSQMYGATESGSQFTSNLQHQLRNAEAKMDPEELLEYKNSVAGYPVPGVDIKLRDPENGEAVPWDGETVGEICFKSPWSTDRYWKMPEKSAEAKTEDGYMKTGDLATIDDRANIRVQDRLKDAIKSGGEWIPTPILENCLTDHPEIDDAVVVAAKHEEWNERPIVIVTLDEGGAPDDLEGRLREHLTEYVDQGEIKEWWMPEEVIIEDQIPTSLAGKYNKKTLKNKYSDILIDQE